MSRLAKLCEILHDIEAAADHLTRGIAFAKEIARSGPFFIEEMTMHLKWVGNMYTIVVRREALVKDLKREIHRALNVQPEVQKLMSWNIRKHAQPATDNTSIRDCDFAKDARLIKIGQTYVRVVKFHFDLKKIIPVHEHLIRSPAYNAMRLKELYANFKARSSADQQPQAPQEAANTTTTTTTTSTTTTKSIFPPQEGEPSSLSHKSTSNQAMTKPGNAVEALSAPARSCL